MLISAYPTFICAQTVQIREFLAQDIPSIAAIYNEHIADGNSTLDCVPYTNDDLLSIITKFNPRETILVAEKEQDIIGWGSIKRYSDRIGYRVACETSIYFYCSETGKGYGSMLQKALINKVKELGYHHVVAKILAINEKSVKFHQRFGFEIVGIQKEIGFSQGKWQDVVIMQLILPEIVPDGC